MKAGSHIIVGILVTAMACFPAAVLAAGDIGPDSTSSLLDSSDDTRAGAEIVKGLCGNFVYMQISARKKCESAWKTALFSRAAAKLCSTTPESSETCLDAVMNRSFQPEVLELCGLFSDSAIKDRSQCLKYFARSKSVYDLKAARFCVDATQRKATAAKECFNLIRDREVDLDRLKACKGKGGGCGLGFSECFSDCVENAVIDSPLRKEALCGKAATKASSAKAFSEPGSGQR